MVVAYEKATKAAPAMRTRPWHALQTREVLRVVLKTAAGAGVER
jgi:hypothetical protein